MSRDVNRLLHFEDSATNWCRRHQLYLCLRQHLNLYCVRNISWFEQPLNILIKRSPTLREFVIHLHLFGILTSKYHLVSCLSCHVIKLTRGLTELFLKIEELKVLFIYCRPSCNKRQVRKFRNWADYTQINEQLSLRKYTWLISRNLKNVWNWSFHWLLVLLSKPRLALIVQMIFQTINMIIINSNKYDNNLCVFVNTVHTRTVIRFFWFSS
jgi:hypothetical protein